MPIIKVSQTKLAEYFKISQTMVSSHLRNNNRLDLVYTVFTHKGVTDDEKRKYILKTSLSEQMKQKIWNVYLERVS